MRRTLVVSWTIIQTVTVITVDSQVVSGDESQGDGLFPPVPDLRPRRGMRVRSRRTVLVVTRRRGRDTCI